MTVLLRRIEADRPWQQMIKQKTVDSAVADPPPWAIREFTPYERDDAGVSVFEADDFESAETLAQRIAGAFAFHRHPIEGGRWMFAAVLKADVEAEGLTVVPTPGSLLHSLVDSTHREIVVAGAEQLLRATRTFLKAALLISVEGVEAAASARRDAKDNCFNYLPIYKRGEKALAGRNLVRFVSEQIVVARGVPA